MTRFVSCCKDAISALIGWTVQVFSEDTVRDLLATMYVAGVDVNSGEFAFKVGFPAKSSLAGVVMAIVPGIMGVVTLEPSKDKCVLLNLDRCHGDVRAGLRACMRWSFTRSSRSGFRLAARPRSRWRPSHRNTTGACIVTC